MGDGTVQPDFFPRVIDSTSLHFAIYVLVPQVFPDFLIIWSDRFIVFLPAVLVN